MCCTGKNQTYVFICTQTDTSAMMIRLFLRNYAVPEEFRRENDLVEFGENKLSAYTFQVATVSELPQVS